MGARGIRASLAPLFSCDHYEDVGLQCRELSRDELDLVLLGQTSTLLSNDQDTNAPNPLAALQYGILPWRNTNLSQDLSETTWNRYRTNHSITHTCPHPAAHVHVHTPTHSYSLTCRYAHTHACTCKHTCTRMPIPSNPLTFTCRCAHTHAHTHTVLDLRM